MTSVMVKVRVMRTSKLAWLVNCDAVNTWIPKSQISKILVLKDGVKILTIPAWLKCSRYVEGWVESLDKQPASLDWNSLTKNWMLLALHLGICVCFNSTDSLTVLSAMNEHQKRRTYGTVYQMVDVGRTC